MNFDEIDRLLVFFTNQVDAFDLGFVFGSGLHSSFLMLVYGATGITAALALVSLGSSTVAKSVGSKLDPGQVARSIVMATILLAPTSYSVDNSSSSEFEAFARSWEGESSDIEVDKGQTKPGQTTEVYVSAAALLFHNAALLLNKLIAGAADHYLDTEGYASSELGQTNIWVFRVLNRSYSDDIKKGPAYERSLVAYRKFCTGVAAKADILNETWRRFGLFGGSFSDGATNPMYKRDSGDRTNIEAATDLLKSTHIEHFLRAEYPAGFQIHHSDHWAQVFTIKSTDTSTETKKFWLGRKGGEAYLAARGSYGSFLAMADPSDPVAGTTMTVGTLSKITWFPSTCYDLYEINLIATKEMHTGAKKAGVKSEQGLKPKANELSAMTISSLVQEAYSKESGIENPYLAEKASDFGLGMFAWLEKLKLQTTLPIILGSLTFAYALAVAIYPMVIAFSVLPERAQLASMYFRIVAVIFLTNILMYLIIKLMGSIMVGLLVTFQNSVYHDTEAAIKLGNMALATQFALIAGIFASPMLAWALVFMDANPIQRSGSRLADGGSAMKTTAATAGTAMFAAGAVGKAVKMAGGGAKITQPSSTTINMVNVANTAQGGKPSAASNRPRINDPKTYDAKKNNDGTWQ